MFNISFFTVNVNDWLPRMYVWLVDWQRQQLSSSHAELLFSLLSAADHDINDIPYDIPAARSSLIKPHTRPAAPATILYDRWPASSPTTTINNCSTTTTLFNPLHQPLFVRDVFVVCLWYSNIEKFCFEAKSLPATLCGLEIFVDTIHFKWLFKIILNHIKL